MSPDAPSTSNQEHILNSWKEIATYLHRGVRTVQRWEAELGLPVRRPRGKRHSAVIATRAELDAWMSSSPLIQKAVNKIGNAVNAKVQQGVGTDRPSLSNEVLNSWKEIARYLSRGVRTVQRWEHELNLPVHRPRARGRSPVLAIRSELDLWLEQCPVVKPGQLSENGNSSTLSATLQASRELQVASHRLRQNMAHSRNQLANTIEKFISNIQQMLPPPGKIEEKANKSGTW